MKLTIERFIFFQDCTIGRLLIDGKFECYTLEDTYRELRQNMTTSEINALKKYGKTAIPTGTYDIDMNTVSPKFQAYEAYNFCNAKLPRLLKVPGFKGILIHIGNSANDTQGCILVGKKINYETHTIEQSTAAFKALMKKLPKTGIQISIE